MAITARATQRLIERLGCDTSVLGADRSSTGPDATRAKDGQ
jgi:hypothetical protein